MTDWPSGSSGSLDFRKEVYDRIATMPVTSDEQWPWTQGTGLGSAAQVAGLHRAVAAGRFRPRDALPIIHRHLERGLTPRVPDDAYGIGFKGGGMPKTLNLGLNVRWKDGRTGALALMMTGLSDDDLTRQVGRAPARGRGDHRSAAVRGVEGGRRRLTVDLVYHLCRLR